MDSLFLQPEDIKELTGKIRPRTQASYLQQMGIPHIINGDGKPLVLKSYIEKQLDPDRSETKNRSKPNWNAL